MTAQEIITAIDKVMKESEHFNTDSPYLYLYYNDYDVDALKEAIGELPEKVTEKQYGDGQYMCVVYHFKNSNVYLRLSGTYSSYDSPYLDGMTEVFQFH